MESMMMKNMCRLASRKLTVRLFQFQKNETILKNGALVRKNESTVHVLYNGTKSVVGMIKSFQRHPQAFDINLLTEYIEPLD
jgi:hypothetical protein